MQPLDLQFGNPGILQDYWEGVEIPSLGIKPTMAYEHRSGIPQLQEEIYRLHQNIKNVGFLHPIDQIVIGNGATQVIQAAIYALNALRSSYRVSARAPHYSRFPVMANMVPGCEWIPPGLVKHRDRVTEIITLPNNPTGQREEPLWALYRIVDLCYNWPQYGSIDQTRADEIMVFSLSKATGHASTRIGWAIVQNHDVALKMRQFIELQSSDVSIQAQIAATEVLAFQNKLHENNQWTVFKHGEMYLQKRWKDIADILKDHPEIDALNSTGMFLWGKTKKEPPNVYFDRLGIKVIRGEHFNSSTNHFRINIGCSYADFLIFMERMKEKK